MLPGVSIRGFLTAAVSFSLSFINPLPSSSVENGGFVDTSILFATGFQIPAKHYQSYADDLTRLLPSASVRFIQDENTIDGSETIEESAAKLSRQIQLAAAGTRNVVLVGHSRGGAVAAYAVAMTPLSSSSRVSALVLLDPVDDIEKHSLAAMASSLIVFPPTLVISTPFGGSSKYYKSAVFESVCAPPDRGPKAFYLALEKKGLENRAKFLEFKSIGHLELLDNHEDLLFASLCATGANAAEETDAKVQQTKAMMELIVSSSITGTSPFSQ